jgi:predicted nucleic acid-binding protein
MTKKLIDSNILIYSYDSTDEEKHNISKKAISEILLKDQGILSVQNLAEFSRAITEKAKKPITKSQAREIILEFEDAIDVVSYNAHTIADALLLSSKYNLHFYDSLLVATMELHHIDEIITEDGGFSKIPWLKVINPFKI